MPKVIHLVNQNVHIEKGSELDPRSTEEDLVIHETWTIVMADRTYGDQHRLTFGKDLRDKLIKGMTGGILLSGEIE